MIRNVEIFDGIHKKTVKGDVLVEGNKISKIFHKPIVAGQDVKVIDDQEKFLMPGLIDAHYHVMMDQVALSKMPNVDMPYLTLYAAKSSEELLMRGFTTIRDVGGNSLSPKKAIDEGIVKGSRIHSAGSIISRTGGQGDFRNSYDVPDNSNRQLTYLEAQGLSVIADGKDQFLLRARGTASSGSSYVEADLGRRRDAVQQGAITGNCIRSGRPGNLYLRACLYVNVDQTCYQCRCQGDRIQPIDG